MKHNLERRLRGLAAQYDRRAVDATQHRPREGEELFIMEGLVDASGYDEASDLRDILTEAADAIRDLKVQA